VDEAKGTILVVDDEEAVRGIVSRKLRLDGYSCVEAADGEGALWQTFMQDFDLVLMDIKMPGLSGMEALPKMVMDHPDTCVVMITAVSDIQTAVEAMKLGAYDYLPKPFNLDDLVMRVERALERRRLVLENREYQLRLEQKVERQVGQIQQYYDEAIQALAREQMALEELEALRRSPSGEATVDTKAAGESSSPVKEFARKLSQLFGDRTPELPGNGDGAACMQTDTTKGEA
jgi:DNA-binding NtrC family response regulator